jgi:hypothetical protein
LLSIFFSIKKDGTVVGWGINTNNQLNISPTLNNVIAISGGEMFSLLLTINE